jgi:hypothetical protein
MKKQIFGAMLVALTALGVSVAAPAQAEPTDTQSASSVVSRLEDQGYNVEVSGSSLPNGSLSGCIVKGVSGLVSDTPESAGRPIEVSDLGTAYVDVLCHAGD